MKEHCLAFF